MSKPKKKLLNMVASSGLSYALLKLTQSKIDPYTRATFGITVGTGMLLGSNPIVRYAGIGLVVGGAFQIADVLKGGKLTSNEATNKVYVLHETKGIVELKNGEVPDYTIDGFCFKGMNGVFKSSDGVYAGIDFNNNIKTFGVGGLVNKLRNAGLKTKEWVDEQNSERWINLYNLSI